VIPSEVVNELDIQTTTAPFNKPDVVKAHQLRRSTDRPILKVQALGPMARVSYQPFSQGLRRATLPALANLYPYKPGPRRKQLLAQAGYPHGPEDHAEHGPAPATRWPKQLQSQPPSRSGHLGDYQGHPGRPTETQYLYLDQDDPAGPSTATAGRNSRWRWLDVLYSQQGLMKRPTAKKSTTSPTVTPGAETRPLRGAAHLGQVPGPPWQAPR